MLEKIGLPAKPALRGNNWVVDGSHCQGCSSQFTFINRKHHCRRCGGLFCSTCTQQRMVLRGQGDSPVRICEPCKKLEEAARFEMRYGHKNKSGRGGSKLTSKHEDDVLNQILGSDRKELASSEGKSTTDMVSRIQRDMSSASCSHVQQVTTHDEEEERPSNLSVEVPSQVLDERGSASPGELRQQALDEKNKYKMLKAEGKSDEALRAFKRGKELERQAGALELSIRKNRKKTLSSSVTPETQKTNDDSTSSGRKNNLFPQKSKEKDDLAAELRELGWSDMDLGDANKKPASMSLEGELSTILGEVSQKTKTEKGPRGIDKTEVFAHKKKALALKREGKLAEAKDELKRAKILEMKLEEEELLVDAEDSDDELSSLIRSIDSNKQDDLLVTYEPDAGLDFAHLMGITDDLGIDGNFEVTEEDMDDPDIAATLHSLGWTDEHFEDSEQQFVPMERESCLSEIQSLKREALSQKRAGNTSEALELLKKAKALEKDLDNYVTQGTESVPSIPVTLRKGSAVHLPEKLSKPNKVDLDGMANPKLAPKSRLMIQKELLGLKKSALALRREGKLDEADEELKKGKVLEQQLEEIDNASKVKAAKVSSNTRADNIVVPDLGDEDGGVTDQDMHDPTYLALLSNLGWKDEEDKNVTLPLKPAKQNGIPVQITDSSITRAASPIRVRESTRSKGEIQRELLGLKRKALAVRRQGETEEAEEVLKMAKLLEVQLEEIETPKEEAQSETSMQKEKEIITSPQKIAAEKVDEGHVLEEDIKDPALPSVRKNLGWRDHHENLVIENLSGKEKLTYEKKEETVLRNKKLLIDAESGPVGETVSHIDQSAVRQEILIFKRKAVALKRDGKLAEAREELQQAKLLEKSLGEDKSHTGTSSSDVSSAISKVTSGGQKDHSSSDLASKPFSSRDRFKLQQESLSHKRLALKLRREGRMEAADAEFELAKSLEAQLEELAANDYTKSSVIGTKPVDDVGVEDFLDPQLLSALKAIGYDDASPASEAPENQKPVRSASGDGENSVQERIQLEEQIKAEKVKAVNLKRLGKQAEALDALRRAKVLEKKLNSLAS